MQRFPPGLGAIQRDPTNITQTRTSELRRLRNSQSLDFLALDEVLESRRQWAGQKWADFTDPWRKYSNVPLGSAPCRKFEDILEVAYRQEPIFNKEKDEPNSELEWKTTESTRRSENFLKPKEYPPDYLPKPHALKRPWHTESSDPHTLPVVSNPPAEDLEFDDIPNGYKLARNPLDPDNGPMLIPDNGSIIHEKYRPILLRLYKLITLTYKTSAVKWFKGFTKDETHVHGYVPVDRFHIALYKTGILSTGDKDNVDCINHNEDLGSFENSWTFKNTMEMCYYLRKFQFRIDGGESDEAMVDLRLLDKLARHIGKEEARDIELYDLAVKRVEFESKMAPANGIGYDNTRVDSLLKTGKSETLKDGTVKAGGGRGESFYRGVNSNAGGNMFKAHHTYGVGHKTFGQPLKIVEHLLDREAKKRDRENKRLTRERNSATELRDKDELFLRTVSGQLGWVAGGNNSPSHKETGMMGRDGIINITFRECVLY